jgi:hypothetical protein
MIRRRADGREKMSRRERIERARGAILRLEDVAKRAN